MADQNKHHYDKRIVDRYVAKGLVKGNELESYMKALPDETANAQFVELDLHDTDLSDDGNSGDDLSENGN